MRPIIILLLVMLLSLSAVAAQKSTSYNGKTYYVVSADVPSENSGNEVCAKVGKSCVGYTAFTTDVCKQLHPTATIKSGVDGSKAGFYCNGAPQQGVCGRETDTCGISPACNVNVKCSEE
ncbi:MAG: hypothetical protein AABX51_07370, partial [Nanoarchaeota archaeon]